MHAPAAQLFTGLVLEGLNTPPDPKIHTIYVVFFTQKIFDKVIDTSAMEAYYRGSS